MTRAPSSSALFSAAWHGILALAVVLAVTAVPAGAQDSEPTPTESLTTLQGIVEDFGCPELPVPDLRIPVAAPSQIRGQVVDGVADVPDTVQIQCRYQILGDAGSLGFDVIFRFATAESRRSSYCGVEPAIDTENEFSNRYSVGTVGESWSRTIEVTGNAEVMALLGDPRDMVTTEWAPYLEAVEPFTQRCQYAPTIISCPALTGYVEADLTQANPNDLMSATCVYNSADEESFDRIQFTLRWATDRSSLDAQRRACEDFGESPRPRVQVIGGDGTAAEVTIYAGVDPATYDPAPWLAAGETIRAQVVEQATSCDEVGVTPVWTPLPEYLQAIYTPERVDSPPLPGVGGPAFFGSTDFTDWSGAAAASTTDASPAPTVTPVVTVPGGDEPLSGWLRTVLRVVAVAGLVISLLGLLFALLLMRRETRIRPVMEIIRIGLAAVMAIVSITLFARGAPAWAVVAALAGGGLLGFLQGRNLSLRRDGEKIMAKRGVIALLAFAGGLILIQIAGLLNRTGVIQMGIALSLASAAITVGLMVGRQPQFAEAKRAGGVAVLLLVVGSLLAAPLLASAPAAAQEDEPAEEPAEPETRLDCPQLRQEGMPRCEAHEALIDLVPWDDIDYNGGLFFQQQKPWVTLEVPRAFESAPDPITRTIEWDRTDSTGDLQASYSITETFTFALRGDGVCCSIDYDGEGTELFTGEGAEPSIQTLVGPLDDINVFGDGITGPLTRATMLNVPFDAESLWTAEGVDECGRIVASTVPNMSRGQLAEAVYTRDGEVTEPFDSVGLAAFRAPCEIEGFTAAAALDLAPPALPRDQRQSPCPSRVELYPQLETEGFEIQAHTTLGPMFTNPNEAICNDGTLFDPVQFGPDARGATRNELTLSFAGQDNATTWGDDETLAFLDRPTDTAAARVCPQNPDGTAVAITEDDQPCEVLSMHKVGDEGGWIMVWVDNQLADGPNVTIRAGMPWGTYRYRCHHCDTNSPEVVNFLGQFHDVAIEWIDGSPGFFEALAGADSVIDDIGSVGLPGSDEQSDDDATRAAAVAAVIATLASGGMLASALAEAGISRDEFIDAIRNDPTGGMDSLLDGMDGISDLYPSEPPEPPEEPPPPSRHPPGSTIVDQWGDPLIVGDDGNLEFYDEDAGRWRSLPAEEAQAMITEQFGEQSIYDPSLGRRVYFDDPAEYAAYEDRVRRQISGDFWTRTDEEWRDSQRRRDWDAARRADELAMSQGRALVEAWEAGQERYRDRAVEGAIRAAESDPALMADVEAMVDAGDYDGLSELYADWMWDQMAESQAEADWQNTVATVARTGELAARATEAASRTAIVVLGGPAGVAYTAGGLAIINGGSEAALAWQRGERIEQIAARTGLGVLAGGRDALMGRINAIPGLPTSATATLNGWGDAAEAYARARLDGATEEQARRAAEIAFTASAASHQVGAVIDKFAPGLGQQLSRAGLGGVAAGWSTWMQGGSFSDGFVDGLAGSAGGALGGRMGGQFQQRPGLYTGIADPQSVPNPLGGTSLEDALLARAGQAGKPRGTIPIEDQGPSVRAAHDALTMEPPQTRIQHVVGDDGVLRPQAVAARPGELQPVTNEAVVMAGLRQTADSRTGKNAPAGTRNAIVNTRAQIYERADRMTIAAASASPEVQAMLRPGDRIEMDTFSTPGKPPSLGADRDARMVIRRTRPDGTVESIEIPRQHWEAEAYSDFANEARNVYRAAGMPVPDASDPEIAIRMRQLEEHHPGMSRQQREDRAFAEAHNQLFTDRNHVEASSANADQATRWVSRVDRDTVDSVSARLRGEGRMGQAEEAFIQRNPDTGDDEFIVRSNGDPETDRRVDPGEWRAEQQERATRLREEYDAWRADPDNNPKPELGRMEQRQVDAEALRTARGEGTITDNAGARLMWEEKARFYARDNVNPAEAIEQARKGVNLLIEQRAGYAGQNYEVPPLNQTDYRAMRVLMDAPHGTQLPSEAARIQAELGRIYGDPNMPLEQSLGRVAAAHEQLALARPRTGPPPAVTPPPTSADLLQASQQHLERSQVDDPFWDSGPIDGGTP